MRARVLALVRPGEERAALAALPSLVAAARARHACVRIACLRPFPPPREDRHGRVVAGVDHEMARLAESTAETFERAARALGEVPVECVVRFGRPRREARLETEAWRPEVVASFERRDVPGTIRWRAIAAPKTSPAAGRPAAGYAT